MFLRGRMGDMGRKAAFGIMLALLLLGIFTLALNIQPVRASGTIYIRADGSVDPPYAPIQNVGNVCYTFTADIYEEIGSFKVPVSDKAF